MIPYVVLSIAITMSVLEEDVVFAYSIWKESKKMAQAANVGIRQRLIDSTIAVVAKDGLNKATTKAISLHSGVNEVYIYRNFDDKDHLLECAFGVLDDEMVGCITKYIPIMHMAEISIEERSWMFFSKFWQFLLGNKQKCSFFIKYYYSNFYDSYPWDLRAQKYEPIKAAIAPAFKEGVDVDRMFNHIFDVIFATVMKVLRGELPENDKTAQDLYELLFSSLENYLSFTVPGRHA